MIITNTDPTSCIANPFFICHNQRLSSSNTRITLVGHCYKFHTALSSVLTVYCEVDLYRGGASHTRSQ